jgi:steroid delta-isomerase-like uncharacterized protein
MSRTETERLVERYFACFNAGDREGMIACLSPDVRHDVNEGEQRIGHDRFRAFMQHMDRCYRETLTGLTVMSNADGSRAAAEFTVNGEYIATDAGLPEARGQRYVLPGGTFLAVQDGRITRLTTYYNLKKWIALVSA